jgi:hypothetical protein
MLIIKNCLKEKEEKEEKKRKKEKRKEKDYTSSAVLLVIPMTPCFTAA